MDLKEFKEFLSSDDGKQALAEVVAKEVEGLKNKQKELLGKLDSEKETSASLKAKIDTLEEAKRKAEDEAIEKTGDIDKITARLRETHTQEIAKKDEALAAYESKLNKHILGNGLTEALVKAGVNAPLMEAAKALIESKYKGEIGDNDGTPFAKFDGQAVGDFVSIWANSDAGKHFVSATNNSGGGAQGANGGSQASSVKTMTRTAFEGLTPKEQMSFSKEGGRLTDD